MLHDSARSKQKGPTVRVSARSDTPQELKLPVRALNRRVRCKRDQPRAFPTEARTGTLFSI